MLRIRDIKLPVGHSEADLKRAIARASGGGMSDGYRLVRQSIDARRKDRIQFVYTVDIEVENEERVLARDRHGRISRVSGSGYTFPVKAGKLRMRPVVVGSGPAGLFAALVLARQGHAPIVFEQGKCMEGRVADVKRFIATGNLEPKSNIQFGEGGAGTFSDGKLTTLIGDPRCALVLKELVEAGAPAQVAYAAKPHVGTDIIRRVVVRLRETLLELGAEVRFESQLTGLDIERGQVKGVVINGQEEIACERVILAVGNSARAVFAMLHDAGVNMVPKGFSIGVRIEHPRELIDRAQYGRYAGHPHLGAADYKMAHRCATDRGVYTFCMCPGGVVVGGASEPGGVVTNGMSEYARDKPLSNSALLVGVNPADFESDHPLAGVTFARKWEKKAFAAGGGGYRAPIQQVGDFLAGKASRDIGCVKPSYRPGVVPADVRDCLPEYVSRSLAEAIVAFDRKIRGFALHEAVLTGVETRSSCPVRIVRDEECRSSIGGLYPAGEGAGYAGGIMSSAVDGIRVAQRLV